MCRTYRVEVSQRHHPSAVVCCEVGWCLGKMRYSWARAPLVPSLEMGRSNGEDGPHPPAMQQEGPSAWEGAERAEELLGPTNTWPLAILFRDPRTAVKLFINAPRDFPQTISDFPEGQFPVLIWMRLRGALWHRILTGASQSPGEPSEEIPHANEGSGLLAPISAEPPSRKTDHFRRLHPQNTPNGFEAGDAWY